MSFVTRPILCGGVGCGFEMSSQLPLALDSSARMNTAKAGCLAQWLGANRSHYRFHFESSG